MNSKMRSDQVALYDPRAVLQSQPDTQKMARQQSNGRNQLSRASMQGVGTAGRRRGPRGESLHGFDTTANGNGSANDNLLSRIGAMGDDAMDLR